MKNGIILSFAIVSAFFTTPGCKTEGCTDPISIDYNSNADKDDGSCRYAGTGGSTTIVAYPRHHSKPIVSSTAYPDTAYVKFNTVESPGVNPAAYDMIVVGDSGEDHVHLEGLKAGKYFIYMTGYDSASSPNRVKGGIPYTLMQSSGEVDVVIPVSEN